jgi:hypothetical protein
LNRSTFCHTPDGIELAFGAPRQRHGSCGMTSLPLVLDDDEPIGIILRAGRKVLRPAKIWAYCWFADEGEAGDHTHRHLPEHVD